MRCLQHARDHAGDEPHADMHVCDHSHTHRQRERHTHIHTHTHTHTHTVWVCCFRPSTLADVSCANRHENDPSHIGRRLSRPHESPISPAPPLLPRRRLKGGLTCMVWWRPAHLQASRVLLRRRWRRRASMTRMTRMREKRTKRRRLPRRELHKRHFSQYYITSL